MGWHAQQGQAASSQRPSSPTSCTCTQPMLTQTFPFSACESPMLQGLSEASKDIWGSKHQPKMPITSVVLKTNTGTCTSLILDSPLNFRATAQQLSQVSSDAGNSLSNWEGGSTLAYISPRSCVNFVPSYQPPRMHPHSPVIKDQPFRKVVAIYHCNGPRGVYMCSFSLKSLFE